MKVASSLATVMMLGFAAVASAAPGDLDSTWGVGGIRTVINGQYTSYSDVVRAPSGSTGRVFATGYTTSGTCPNCKLVPILTAFNETTGAVDTTFGTSGHVIDTTLSGSLVGSSSITMGVYGSSYVFRAFALDSTGDGEADDLVVYSNLVHTSSPQPGSQIWRTIVPFASGQAGRQPAIIATCCNQTLLGVATGGAEAGGTKQGVFLRFGFTDGVLVSTWGTGGKRYISTGTQSEFSAVASFASATNFCAVGKTRSGTNPWDTVVSCVKWSTGALDTAFDGDGVKTVNWGDASYPNAHGRAINMKVSSAELTVAANLCNSAGTVCRVGLARVTSAGAFDSTFDGDGLASYNLGGFGTIIGNNDILVYGPSRYYLAGQKWVDSGHTTTDRFLFAFTGSGAPDTTFAPGGQRTYSSISTGLEGYAGIAYNWNSTKLLAAGDRDSGSNIVGTVTQHLNN